ncbi:MAG: di-heme oxidoredictase family protein [Vicinamibacterales bacterium]
MLGLAAAVAGAQAPDVSADQGRRARLAPTGRIAVEASASAQRGVREAAAAFDNQTNGLVAQGPPMSFITRRTVRPTRSFNDARFLYEEVAQLGDGLGPTYNAQSCRECHQNVVTGGASQIAEHRTGHLLDGQFFESLGGSLVHSRSTHPDMAELVAVEDDIRTFRISTNTLGAGFIEAIANDTILAIRDAQPAHMRGTAVSVPVLEAGGAARIGRFGWKNQHASLLSFAADALLNELGLTSPLFPDENTSAGRPVQAYDPVPDPEDNGAIARGLALFMRATKAPPRGALTPETGAGEAIFQRIGCSTCHVPSLVTAPPGTAVNGGTFTVPDALGSRRIHPYSDFLSHDIGTGDGIPVLPTPEYAETAARMRTAPLWALRTRNRLMHDGLSFTLEEAIDRHRGQAEEVRQQYLALSGADRALLLAFLRSL